MLILELKNNFIDSISTVVSARTIQRALHESGYSGYKGARKPFVNGRRDYVGQSREKTAK